jgi:hypothetical protein
MLAICASGRVAAAAQGQPGQVQTDRPPSVLSSSKATFLR